MPDLCSHRVYKIENGLEYNEYPQFRIWVEAVEACQKQVDEELPKIIRRVREEERDYYTRKKCYTYGDMEQV